MHWAFDRVGEAKKPVRYWRRLELLAFQCSDLDVVESRHKIRNDLCRFVFGYGVRTGLFVRLEDVLKSAPIRAAPRYRNNSTAIAALASKRESKKV